MAGLRRVPVSVVSIYRDENEVAAARGGENLRLRLGGIDEEDIQAGFVICSRNCPVRPFCSLSFSLSLPGIVIFLQHDKADSKNV